MGCSSGPVRLLGAHEPPLPPLHCKARKWKAEVREAAGTAAAPWASGRLWAPSLPTAQLETRAGWRACGQEVRQPAAHGGQGCSASHSQHPRQQKSGLAGPPHAWSQPHSLRTVLPRSSAEGRAWAYSPSTKPQSSGPVGHCCFSSGVRSSLGGLESRAGALGKLPVMGLVCCRHVAPSASHKCTAAAHGSVISL